jgi:hypothetical protein
MSVNSPVGPRILRRTPGDRVIFAVVLARPLVMHWLTVAVGAIHRDFPTWTVASFPL